LRFTRERGFQILVGFGHNKILQNNNLQSQL
jgi:hypothetical protein